MANISKSTKGTAEKHGKMVKQKSGLNRAILDQSWFEFKRQLEYKSAWLGGFFAQCSAIKYQPNLPQGKNE